MMEQPACRVSSSCSFAYCNIAMIMHQNNRQAGVLAMTTMSPTGMQHDGQCDKERLKWWTQQLLMLNTCCNEHMGQHWLTRSRVHYCNVTNLECSRRYATSPSKPYTLTPAFPSLLAPLAEPPFPSPAQWPPSASLQLPPCACSGPSLPWC